MPYLVRCRPEMMEGLVRLRELISFLRARFDNDEQVARAAAYELCEAPKRWVEDDSTVAIPVRDTAGGTTKGIFTVVSPRDVGRLLVEHVARHDPARVLAEVETGRQLLATYEAAVRRKRATWRNCAA